MTSIQMRENVPLHFVAICSLGALLTMILTVLGIKLRWFRHRLTFDRLPTAPKRDSTEDSVVVTGFYRKSVDFDNFVAIERPESLPPIRLDKRSTQKNSNLIRNTILNIDNSPEEGLKVIAGSNKSEEVVIQEKSQQRIENVAQKLPATRKKAPQPPSQEMGQASLSSEANQPIKSSAEVADPPIKSNSARSSNPPSFESQTSNKKKSIFGNKSPIEARTNITKVRVLKQKHIKDSRDRIVVVERKKDRPSIIQEKARPSANRSDNCDKILAESTTFIPVAIPRNANPVKEPEVEQMMEEDKRNGRQLQFAPNDEIIGESENYDSWDLVSRHRQSLNHLSVTPTPKPRPRDSVAYHRQKVIPTPLTFIETDEHIDRPPKTLREMQKEREKLSIVKDYSDTEA